MNNSKYFLALTLAIALNVSCSKFDDGPAISFIPAESRLTGEWVVVEFEGGPYADDYNGYLASGAFIKFEFDGDGTGRWSYGYAEDGYSYEYGYNTTWDLDDNDLNVEFDGNNFNFEVQRLTRKEMTLLPLNNGFLVDSGVSIKLEKE